MVKKIPTKPTILQILPALERGGVECGTVQIDNAIVDNGWNSIVVSSGGKMVKDLKGQHLELPLCTKNPIKMLFNAHLLKYVIKENNVDIVHARSRAPAWSAYMAAKKTGTTFLTTFHGTYKIQNCFKKKANSVMTKGEHIIAVSNFVKDHIMSNYGIAEEKITVIQRGTDLEYFDPKTKPIDCGLPKGKKVVMLPGRITRWKGQTVFAEAMKNVDATGVIVGATESEGYMKELERIMPDNVIIFPSPAKMPEMLANADIVVTASIEPEAFGRIAVEGQAMGKPVVATAHGGSLETVIEGKTGSLIPANDSDAMADAINKLLSSKKSWKADCTKNAKEFSLEKMCEKTLKVYEKLLS